MKMKHTKAQDVSALAFILSLLILPSSTVTALFSLRLHLKPSLHGGVGIGDVMTSKN